MGKRYYCDYCDKSFADNPTSRKTHLFGNAHLQNRKAHYAALRGEEEILREDQNKKPCRAFLSTGQCKFGDRCQYSHLTNEDRARLTQVVNQKQQLAQARLGETTSTDSDVKSALEAWMETRRKRRKLEEEADIKGSHCTLRSDTVPEYKLAECLSCIPTSLPPSLLPPSKEAILNSTYSEWG